MRRFVFLFIAILVSNTGIGAQSPNSNSRNVNSTEEENIARIVGYSLTQDGALNFLEALTDTIGGRITRGSGPRETGGFILKKLKKAGVDKAQFEEDQLTSPFQQSAGPGEGFSHVR